MAGMWLCVAWNVLHEWRGRLETGCYIRKNMTGSFYRVLKPCCTWLVACDSDRCNMCRGMRTWCSTDRSGSSIEVVVESTVTDIFTIRVRPVARTENGG